MEESEAAQLVCWVSGTPTPTITWLKDDQVIGESRDYSMLTLTHQRHLLIVTNTTQHFTGRYTCRATNGLGEVTSTATLRIREDVHEEEEEEEEDKDVTEERHVEMKTESVEVYFELKEELGRYCSLMTSW